MGYLNVTQLGNPLVVKLYSKISENFAKSIFINDRKESNKYPDLIDSDEFFEKLVERFVGFIYYGCNALKEIYHLLDEDIINTLQEIAFKYGLLIYLKEELESFKENSQKFFVIYT